MSTTFQVALLQPHPPMPQDINDALTAEMTRNLQLILGGPEAAIEAAAEALAQAKPLPGGHVEVKPGRFAAAFAAAEQATWMMRNRPPGAHFSIAIALATAH